MAPEYIPRHQEALSRLVLGYFLLMTMWHRESIEYDCCSICSAATRCKPSPERAWIGLVDPHTPNSSSEATQGRHRKMWSRKRTQRDIAVLCFWPRHGHKNPITNTSVSRSTTKKKKVCWIRTIHWNWVEFQTTNLRVVRCGKTSGMVSNTSGSKPSTL